jgi:hypothetical protein
LKIDASSANSNAGQDIRSCGWCFSNCCQDKLFGFSSDDKKNGTAVKFVLDAAGSGG